MKKKPAKKITFISKITPQGALNAFFICAILMLFYIIHTQQMQLEGAFRSLGWQVNYSQRLEIDLRNRGIINQELLDYTEYKPYSLEQMEEFQKWVKENQTAEKAEK
jgi:hypothetical protein